MLDDLTVFKAEEVHYRQAAVVRLADEITVHRDHVVFRYEALEFHVFRPG